MLSSVIYELNTTGPNVQQHTLGWHCTLEWPIVLIHHLAWGKLIWKRVQEEDIPLFGTEREKGFLNNLYSKAPIYNKNYHSSFYNQRVSCNQPVENNQSISCSLNGKMKCLHNGISVLLCRPYQARTIIVRIQLLSASILVFILYWILERSIDYFIL